MAKELQVAERIYAIINIQNFIELLGEEIKNSTEDFIEHIAKLYTGPDCDAKTNEEIIKQL